MLRIGQKFFTGIGTYEIKEHLGQGKTAEVYLGINTRTTQAVAIKIAREDMGERVRQNFLREEEVLNRLQEISPDSGLFPRVFYRGEKGEQSYLVMSLVTANSLWDMALENKGRLSGSLELERLALDAAASYAQMLMILHHAGFAATDRKLDDVLWLADEKKVIVLDWNAVGSGDIGQRNDLYQFGVFWHQLLLGSVPPRGGQSLSSHPYWDEYGEGEDGVVGLTYGTQRILAQSLHPQPEARFKMAESLLLEIEQQQKRLHTSLEQLISLADAQKQSQPGEAYALLDIVIKLYRDYRPSSAYETWKELRQTITGIGQNLIKQGRINFEKREFAQAKVDFQNALKNIGDDAPKQLHIHRWLVLLEAMPGQPKPILEASARLVQAMNEAWNEVEQRFAHLKRSMESPLPDGVRNLERDFLMVQHVKRAGEAIEQRNYQSAGKEYQDAYDNRQALPPDYRTRLMRAGWQNLDLYAYACADLAKTEGEASRLLAEALAALEKNDLPVAKAALESGYALILSRSAREARERLIDVALPPPLDDQFIRTFYSLSLHQLASSSDPLQKQLHYLSLLRDQFPDESWASRKLTQLRQQLVDQLTSPNDGQFIYQQLQQLRLQLKSSSEKDGQITRQQMEELLRQLDDKHWQVADKLVNWAKEEPFYAEPEVQNALATYKQVTTRNLIAEMDVHRQSVQKMLQAGPTKVLLGAAAQRLALMQTNLDRVRELTPLVFAPETLDSQTQQVAHVQQEIQQKNSDWQALLTLADLHNSNFDEQGETLSDEDKRVIEAVLQDNQIVIQQQTELANRFKRKVAEDLLAAATEDINQYQYSLAHSRYAKLIEDKSLLEADRQRATLAIQQLDEIEVEYAQAKTKLALAQEQFDTTSVTPPSVEGEIGRLQEIITAVSRLTHPALQTETKTLIELATERIQTIRRMKAREYLARAYQLDEQVLLHPENADETIQTLNRAIAAAQQVTLWDAERQTEVAQLITRIQKRIQAIQTWVQQTKARSYLDEAYQLEKRVIFPPENPDTALQMLHQVSIIAQQAPVFDAQCQSEAELLLRQIKERIEHINTWVQQQAEKAEADRKAKLVAEEEARRSAQEAIARQSLENAYKLLKEINTSPDDPDSIIKHLDDINLSIQMVQGDHPNLVKEAAPLEKQAQKLIAQIRQFKVEQKLKAARGAVASLKETDAPRLHQVKVQVEALFHTVLAEWPAGKEEVENLKQSLLKMGQEIAQYERQKQIDQLRQQIELVFWPEAGKTDVLLGTLQKTMPLISRCRQLLEFPDLAQTEPMTEQVKELLTHVKQTITTAWEQEINWLTAQVKQPGEGGAVRLELAKVTVHSLSRSHVIRENATLNALRSTRRRASRQRIPRGAENEGSERLLAKIVQTSGSETTASSPSLASSSANLEKRVPVHSPSRSHVLRGNATLNALRSTRRRALRQRIPRGAWNEGSERVEKKLNALRRMADIVATDTTLMLPLEQTKQIIQTLRDDLWEKQVEQLDALAVGAIAQEKYEQATLFMDKARGVQELLSPTARAKPRQNPDERLLEIARNSAKEEKFALVLQISTFLRRYYQHLEQSGLVPQQLVEVTQLETDALSHIIGDKRRTEIAKNYRKEATTLWGLNPLTGSVDYHRALDFWGWAVVFDPDILREKDGMEQAMVQAWQERHDNRLRARFLCQRSQITLKPALRERFVWLKEAYYLAPELKEIQVTYQEVVGEINAKGAELGQLIQTAREHLAKMENELAKGKCNVIEGQIALLPEEDDLQGGGDVAEAQLRVQEAQELMNEVQNVMLINKLQQEGNLDGLLKVIALKQPLPSALKKSLQQTFTPSVPSRYTATVVKQDMLRLSLNYYLLQIPVLSGEGVS